jgi:hypothetical protein
MHNALLILDFRRMLRLHRVMLAACICIACAGALAQAASPDYTADMPSVDRVKAEIKGSDPTDTLARQVAVFTYLSEYIKRIKYNRTVRGPYWDSEARVMGAYDLASYHISQDYAKSHTPDEAKAFEHLHGRYEMNPDFNADWNKLLMGPQSAAAYKSAESQLAATGQAHYEKEMQQYKQDRAAQQAADKQIFGTKELSDDPTAVATRRCLELGGSSLACVGKGFGAGLMDMIGFNAEAQEALTGPGRAGVVLSGLYKNPATTATLSFGADNVSLDGCGKLVADGHNYAIAKRPGSLRVTVENEPHPFVLTMRPDGGFTGPGLIDVKGRIIIGYHTETTTWTHSDGSYAGTTSAQVADYAPATARCSIGSLAPPPPPKPASAGAPAQPADESGMMGLVTGLADMLSLGGGAPVDGGGGLRMVGKYGGGMLLLDFSSNSLVLDCGQAHVRASYTVENAPNAFLIHVQNSGGPFTLALMPDNSLRGSGSTTVDGRLVTGMNGDNVTFAPHSERCEVGTLRPKAGATPTTSVAASPAAASSAPSAATGSVAHVPAPSPGTAAELKLVITASFPAGANPLAGRAVLLMTERYDNALRKVGAPIAADATPGKALLAYSANCLASKGCPSYAAAMHPYFVGKATFDGTGKATLITPAPPGSYFVFCSANTSDSGLVWDVPVTLKAGDNAISLSTANAELVH